jgi:nicotinamidase-related amidase
MKDALLLVDVVNDFLHEDGEALLASYERAHANLRAALERARELGVPVVYANDNFGIWDGDVQRLVRHAIEEGRGGELVEEVSPREGDRFVVKPRYSAFDHTPLVLVLRELGVERVLIAGAATEMCVVQSAIDARELGFKVSIIGDACSSVDEGHRRLALRYAEEVVGARLHGLDQVGRSPSVAE